MNTEACKYKIKDLDKIVNYKTWTPKQKTDVLFHMDSTLYCNMGIDSTIREKRELRTQSRLIYKAIKKINGSLGRSLLDAMDI
jgi:hypothetical protein